MILGREKSNLGINGLKNSPARAGYDLGSKIKIYGKGINYKSVKNVNLQLNSSMSNEKENRYDNSADQGKKKPMFKLPKIY
jgi:hypothetical protein